MFGFLQLNCRTALRRTLLLMALSMAVIAGYAQDYSKMSISTQMFLDRINGKIDTDDGPQRARAHQLGLHTVGDQKYDSYVAGPDTINGRVYMSAFVRLSDKFGVSDLESLGVEIQETFLDGKLVTALIPIDKIDAVTELSKVTKVKAATMMRPSTNAAREKTNVDDVLTNSADAQSAGLSTAYDGSGVVLGVIDTGIDFNHIAFKDKNGNSRIKKAYVVTGSTNSYTGSVTWNTPVEYGEGTSNTISNTTTDDKAEDHGTHTSSTAGGSSVKVSGSTVTVTDNHANATYGGMAPGADLYLAGVYSLGDTYLANAVNKMVQYADSKGMPLVVSNSWGSQLGPHDGTGDVADIYNDLFGDAHPNRVALFAASNDGGKSPASEAGGFHVRGTTSSSNPLGSILRCHYYSDTDNGFMYNGIVTNAWFRSTLSNVTVKVLVLNSNTGEKLAETTVTPTSSGASVSGLSTYYSGSLYAYKDYVSANGKTQVMLYGNSLQSRSYDSNYNSNYTLAIQIYPNSGSAVLDMWGGNTGYFTSHLTTSGYTWTNGSDDMCVSDEATIPNAISIGAYASKNGGSNTSYTIGDIASFSSWATASASPTGLAYPWITAPGARLIAGVNHNHTSGDYSYYDGQSADMVVNSSTNPYAYMEGTSMATPTAAGIVALWLQASMDENAKDEWKNLTVNKVKQLMATTAIHDSYTNGTNASHFGNGKIDALAGIEEILDHNSPKITANPTSLAFGDVTAGTSTTMTFTVTGENLEGNITLAKIGNNFSIDKTTVTKNSDGSASATVTVTFAPTANTTANYTGTVTLTSSNATTVTVNLTGRGVYNAPVIAANPTSVTFTGNSGSTYTKTVTVTGTNLQGNVTAAINNDANGFYSVSPTSFNAASQTVTITWHPTSGGTSTANLVLTTTGTGANTVTVPITGTAQGPAITATPTSLSFGTVNVGESATQTFTVTGVRLEGNIALAKSGNNFSIDQTSIAKGSDGTASATVTVTYTPTADGNDTGTVTLTSQGAETVTVSLAGTGHVLNPTINVSPDALTLATYVNEPTTQTFTVTGSDLSKTVYLALQNDDAGVFSLSQSSIAANVVNGSGREITVTFAPTVLGDYTATVRLTSTGAETKYVTLNASAVEHVPALTVTPQSVNFGSVEPGTPATQTITLNGEYLMGDVTLTLDDQAGVFTLSDATVSKADAEAGKTVTVTFTATEETTYTGSITVATSGLQSITIPLTAEVSTGGTASDAYLDIAKYATIDEAGWQSSNVTGLDNFYKYTEYPNDDCAWLTLPVYGAWTGVYYNNNPQKWIKSNLTTTSSVNGSATWDASDIYLGSSSYFSSNSKYFGNTSTRASANRTVTFYVTNTTAVKLLGLNGTRATGGSTYPTTMYVYECTLNNDGTLTEGTSAVKSFSNATNSASINFEATDLEATKIYKVVAGVIRGYLYEIGFQTPLNKPSLVASPTGKDIIAEPGEVVTETVTLTGYRLTEDVTVTLTDENGCYSVTPTTISAADAMAGTTVTVTFTAPETEGSYRGRVNFTSGEATASTLFYGAVGEKGSAYSRYLDIAKYSTIAEQDWYSNYIDKPYKFTEYESDNCAWLTIPSATGYYGFLAGDLNWAGVSSGIYRITGSGGTALTWDSNDVFPGSSEYFTTKNSIAIGEIYDNTEDVYSIYFVTNCTQVKAYGYNTQNIYSNSYWSSYDYRPFLQIQECTLNQDGTLTVSDDVTDSQTNSTSSTAITLTSIELDKDKIYVVFVGGARSYFYEVAFRTPLEAKVDLATVVDESNLNKYYRIVDGDLTGVKLSADGKTLYCKDANGKAVNMCEMEDGQTDYVRNVAGLMSTEYDQSNWVALHTTSETGLSSLLNHTLTGVKGVYTNTVNPTIELSATPVSASENQYTYNVYVPCNFMSTEQESASGTRYFFMTPKPMEVMTVHFAMWNGESFEIPTSAGYSNQAGLVGDVSADFSLYADGAAVKDTLQTGHVYKFTGLACKTTKPAGGVSTLNSQVTPGHDVDNLMVYPLDGLEYIGEYNEHGLPTAVDQLIVGREVKSVTYHNVHGQTSMTPFDGVNIVEVRYTDGTRRIVKIMK